MKTVKQLQLLSLAVMLLAVSACQSKPKDGLTDTYTSGVIAIAADESFQPIVQEEVDVFEGLFPLAGIVPRYVTEVEAVNLLLKDSLRLAITSRRLTPEEVNSFNSRKFFPQEIKIATDGLALITNRENPDTLITVNEIRSILTGKVTQWKEIYPASRLKDIRLVFDNNLLALQSVSLSYELPRKISQKMYMERVKLLLSSTDLFRLSSVKQERGTSYPFARTFSIGLNVTF